MTCQRLTSSSQDERERRDILDGDFEGPRHSVLERSMKWRISIDRQLHSDASIANLLRDARHAGGYRPELRPRKSFETQRRRLTRVDASERGIGTKLRSDDQSARWDNRGQLFAFLDDCASPKDRGLANGAFNRCSNAPPFDLVAETLDAGCHGAAWRVQSGHLRLEPFEADVTLAVARRLLLRDASRGRREGRD